MMDLTFASMFVADIWIDPHNCGSTSVDRRGGYSPARLFKKAASHVHATVHLQNLARDVGSVGRSEEGDGFCDLFSGPQASQGDDLEHLGPHLFRDVGGHVGADEAGGHRVDPDV